MLALTIAAALAVIPADVSTALAANTHCVQAKAVSLDDRVSDAATIAKAIENACGVEFEAMVEALAKAQGGDQNPTLVANLQNNLEPVQSAMALDSVLKSRAQYRAKHKP